MSPTRRLAPADDAPAREPRRDTHVTHQDAPVRPGISPQDPATMPRAEDDAYTRAHSPEFHDRPGSGRHTDERHKYY
jgi:hypothetical protein